MAPTGHISEGRVENIANNQLVVWVFTSAVVVAVVRFIGGYVLKRMPVATSPNDVMLRLVDQLQEEVERLRKRLDEVEARNATLMLQAEEREATLIVRLRAVKDAHEARIEELYADLERARIRITALELENKRLIAAQDGAAL